jgi:hypothetical protein
MKRSLLVGLALGMLSGGQTLTVRLYDLANVPAGMLERASAVATQELAQAGVMVTWEKGDSTSLEARITDMSDPRSGPARGGREYLAVRLVHGIPAGVYAGATGYALPFARQGAHATIFYDRVENLLSSSAVGPSVCKILGGAMAHEIGHVLLGSKEHSAQGIMKACWGPAEFRLLACNRLLFTPENSAAMRAGAYRRIEAVCAAGAVFFSSASINGFRNCN